MQKFKQTKRAEEVYMTDSDSNSTADAGESARL